MDLPPFPREVNGNGEGDMKQHKMECGTSLSWSLINVPEIAIGKWFNSAGTKFPKHAHPQKEWLIIYKGHMTVHLDDRDVTLGAGDYIYLEPGTEHSATVLEDCWYAAIVIPRSEDWPT